ncbi:MAG TPA: alcohol dehydrogenase catalytic domain-containing protein [Pseudonocardia sp.]|nr:alcohol dehydrogenase catalytic domain-containing protein [Pseudonocardia sp.]
MQRLVFDGPGAVHWEDAPDPVAGAPGAAIVAPLAVATCDLDVAVLAGRYPLPGPFPFGHEGVAEVVAVGPDVTGVAPGDRVVVPFQISCGECPPCRRGRTGNCATHPRMSSYGLGGLGGTGWGGLLADLVAVPHADAMLVPLPAGIDPVVVASASDNLPDAWRTVGPPLAADPGADVLVVGGPGGAWSIGLYAAGMAVALGAGRVVYVDEDPARLAVAARLGAEPVEGLPGRRIGSFPVTVDAGGSPDGLRFALERTARDGVCTSPSIYLQDVPFPLLAMYSRGCTFHTGRVHARPAVPEVLDLVSRGFDPGAVTVAVAPFADAPAVLAQPAGKTVFTR